MAEEHVTDPRVSRRLLLAGVAGVALTGTRLPGLGVADAAAATPPSVYEVRAYGAVGDGSTDDTAAVQAAIDAARDGGGGTVVFHAGTFLISSSLTLYSKIVLRGAGPAATVLKKASGGSSFALVKSDGFDDLTGRDVHGGTTGWSLQELALDGNRAGGAGGHGLQVYAYGYSLFDVRISECEGRGIWSEYNLFGNDEAESTLLNVKVSTCSAGGILWQGPHDSRWVNVVAAKCGPVGVTSGSATDGVEIRAPSAGLKITNSHVWGTEHRYAWRIDCQGVSLMNCMGEGAEQAQVLVGRNDCVIMGGLYFAARPPSDDTVGIEIGTPGRSVVGTLVNTRITGCIRGTLRFTRDGGNGSYTLSVWQVGGSVVVVAPPAQAPHPTNRFDLLVGGGASFGALGTGSAVTIRDDVTTGGLRAEGDVQAGGAGSRVGFFGSSGTRRSEGWGVAGDPDRRLLRGNAGEGEVREVLATLIRELQRYGLLGDGR